MAEAEPIRASAHSSFVGFANGCQGGKTFTRRTQRALKHSCLCFWSQTQLQLSQSQLCFVEMVQRKV